MANAPLRNPFLHGKHTLVKADLGTKRACPGCSVRFYDLGKRPIECPKCGTSFEPESLFKQRRNRAAEPAGNGAVEAAEAEDDDEGDDDDDEDNDTEAEEEEEIVEETPLKVTATGEDEDGEDEEEEEEDEDDRGAMRVVEPGETGDDDIEDIEIDDDDEDDDEDDDLLGEVEDEEDDVSGIIDTGIEKDEN